MTPNRLILPEKISVNTGIKSNIKQLPPELLTRNEQKAILPYLSAPRVLSKAEKWATDWFHRTKELEEADAYHERIRLQINLPERSVPLQPKEVRVVNMDEIVGKITKGINDNVGPSPPPPPQGPPPAPPSSRNGGKGKAVDNVAQINPLTREISTTSTQTMREVAEAATSARPSVATGSTQTDDEPRTGGNVTMALDPPLQQIVHNYQNYHTVNNYLQNHQTDVVHNTMLNTHNQVMVDARSVQNVLHMHNSQQILNQHIAHRPTIHNPLEQNVIEGPLQVPAVTYQNRLMIEAPINQPVRLPVPDVLPPNNELPAYGDIDMDFGPANPPGYQPRRQRGRRIVPIVMPQAPLPPAYQRLENPNRFRPRITGRLTPAQTAARIIERRNQPENRVVQLPEIPAAHAYDTRPAVPELRVRDEGWYMQGIDDAPKPGQKRKGARLVKDVTPKRRRIAY
ncbi:hypothetical protein HK097_008988 [Rhizophlyctis rosea]|uniref:Uncharacterized protein n=1 Tax=Rhizophlyctis rosea TaxID=64517 RepID=A0AAD5X0R8_9FUNG|nr:hypothetical protein HK097_008988 [Rhizophlyctis rosea]